LDRFRGGLDGACLRWDTMTGFVNRIINLPIPERKKGFIEPLNNSQLLKKLVN
jgi:hypothetical protein